MAIKKVPFVLRIDFYVLHLARRTEMRSGLLSGHAPGRAPFKPAVSQKGQILAYTHSFFLTFHAGIVATTTHTYLSGSYSSLSNLILSSLSLLTAFNVQPHNSSCFPTI